MGIIRSPDSLSEGCQRGNMRFLKAGKASRLNS